jgi:multidrug efflux pump
VNVQAAPRFRTDTSALKDFQVRNSQGQMIPLGTVLNIKHSAGPLLVMRYNMYSSAAINGTPAPGVSSGDVIAVMTDLADDVGVKFEWTEMTFLEVEAGNVALLVFALGGLLVYFVLAAKYESWRLPVAVILVVPLCMLAAVLGMTIAKLPVDIFVQIGLLVLFGLASKNAILIVEYARQLHEEGKNAHDAAIESAQIRFRPIIMTSLAFIFGVAPLVAASGAGAEMRQSLGIAVFSGMIGVTFFGVILTPVFYYVLTHLADRRRANRSTPATGTIPSDDRGLAS